MTLNIDLEDVPDAILEAVKARILANRRRLLDQQQQQQPAALQPKPQFRKFGADSSTWKRPQPAAVPSAQQTKIGAFQTIQSSQTSEESFADLQGNYQAGYLGTNIIVTHSKMGGVSSYNRTTEATAQLFSASRQSSVSIPLPLLSYSVPTGYQPQYQELGASIESGSSGPVKVYRFRWIINNVTTVVETNRIGFLCLPVQADRFIVIVLFSHSVIIDTSSISCFPVQVFQSYFGESIEGWPSSELIAAIQADYLSGDRTVHYTQSPTSFDYSQAFPNLNYVGTSETNTETSVQSAGKFYKAFIFSNNAIREITVKGPLLALVSTDQYFGETPPATVDGKSLQSNVGQPATPYVFDQLNQRIGFTSVDQIKSFPANKKPILSDVRAGFFAMTQSDLPSYGNEPIWAEYAGNTSSVPSPTHNDSALYPKYRKLANAGVPFPVDGLNTGIINFNWVWDWDDPAYCRRMCLALGFTAADLTP